VIFKITIILKSNTEHLKFDDNLKSYMTFWRTQKEIVILITNWDMLDIHLLIIFYSFLDDKVLSSTDQMMNLKNEMDKN
jgi:hypothetical protein